MNLTAPLRGVVSEEYVLIHPNMWNHGDQIVASKEGWCILVSTLPGDCKIMRLMAQSLEKPFLSDLQAAEYVMERMHQGSEFHTRAWIALMKSQLHGCGREGDT